MQRKLQDHHSMGVYEVQKKGPSVQEGPFVIYENKNWVR